MDMAKLAALARDPSAAMDIGKAAEHLVCADLILEGHRCFLSDQGLPYDLLVDAAGRIVRVQVKATCFARNVNASGRNERIAYSWSVRRRGRDKRGAPLSADHCDVVALVALDIRAVAYFAQPECGQTMQLLAPGGAHRQGGKAPRWTGTVDSYPFEAALSRCR